MRVYRRRQPARPHHSSETSHAHPTPDPRPQTRDRGPFRADQLRDGDRYELSNGHPIYCHPSERRHAGPNLTGGAALETDPDVQWAGVDAGFTPELCSLRAPDVAVGPAGDEPGWISGVPPLALEYAGPGQDEADLEAKIAELLANGTQQVWVVRLIGPRRVEVHRPETPMRTVGPGEALTAPGILRNPVSVEALCDRSASHRRQRYERGLQPLLLRNVRCRAYIKPALLAMPNNRAWQGFVQQQPVHAAPRMMI